MTTLLVVALCLMFVGVACHFIAAMRTEPELSELEQVEQDIAAYQETDRSGREDATDDDLGGWDFLQEGRLLLAQRLRADTKKPTAPEPARELPIIVPSPLRRGWGTPPPVERPLVRPPGPVTRELQRIIDSEQVTLW